MPSGPSIALVVAAEERAALLELSYLAASALPSVHLYGLAVLLLLSLSFLKCSKIGLR